MELTIENLDQIEVSKKRFYLPSVTKSHTVSEIIQSFHLNKQAKLIQNFKSSKKSSCNSSTTCSSTPSTNTCNSISTDLSSQKYVFIFKWKHSERQLPPNEKPLLLTQNFNRADCKFIIRISNSQSGKKLVLCKNKKCKFEISKTSSCIGGDKAMYGKSHFHVKSRVHEVSCRSNFSAPSRTHSEQNKGKTSNPDKSSAQQKSGKTVLGDF